MTASATEIESERGERHERDARHGKVSEQAVVYCGINNQSHARTNSVTTPACIGTTVCAWQR